MKSSIWLVSVLLLGCSAALPQEIGSIYVTNCSNCHGADGRGNTPLGRILKLPDLRSTVVQHISEAELAGIIAKGAARGKMPGFEKNLGAEIVQQLASYVREINRQPEPIETAPASKEIKPMDVKSVYSAKCANCHGEDGSGNTVLGREIKLRDMRLPEAQALSDTELIATIANGTARGQMPGFQKKLGREMVQQLASYVRALAGRSPNTKSETPPEAKASSLEDKAAVGSAGATALSEPVQAAEPVSKDALPVNVPSLPKSQNEQAANSASVRIPVPAGARAGKPKLVDLNSASKETLMTLPGLTEAEALDIVNGRPYKSVLQFKIRGIVDAEVYERIAGRVIAKQPAKKKPATN